MKWKLCKSFKKPVIIKNKFKSTIIGTIGIYLGIGFIYPMSYLSVYITSYIHIKQEFVNMHYGYFLNLILNLALSFSVSLGGMMENKLGFNMTIILGTIIIFISNIFFFRIQNIWACYFLTLIIGIGGGISTSLLGKNLTLYHPKKKGIIVSIIGLAIILIAGIFLIVGEKIISLTGETLEENVEVYSPLTASRTYLYFMLGFFTIPIGDIIFLLFSYEYKNSNVFDLNVPNEDNENNLINSENKEETTQNLIIDEQEEKVQKEKKEKKEKKEEKEKQEKEEEEEKDNKVEKEKKEEKEEEKEEIEEKEKKEEKENKEEEKENEEEKEVKEEEPYLKNYEENQNNNNNLDIDLKLEEDKGKKKINQVIKTFRFWRIGIASFLLSFPISFMMTTGRTFGALIGIKGAALQFLTAIQGVAIIIIGPIFGILSDKKSPLLVLIISSLVSILPGIILLFFIDNTILYIISFVFIALGLVSKMVSFSPLLMEIYGITESVILGGIINGIGRVSEAITTLAAFIISFHFEGNEIKYPYKIIFIVGSGCSLLSFILLLFESKKKFVYKEEVDKIDKLIDNDNITEVEKNGINSDI